MCPVLSVCHGNVGSIKCTLFLYFNPLVCKGSQSLEQRWEGCYVIRVSGYQAISNSTLVAGFAIEIYIQLGSCDESRFDICQLVLVEINFQGIDDSAKTVSTELVAVWPWISLTFAFGSHLGRKYH